MGRAGQKIGRGLHAGHGTLEISPAGLKHHIEVFEIAAGQQIWSESGGANAVDQAPVRGQSIEAQGRRAGSRRGEFFVVDRVVPVKSLDLAQ